MGNITTLQDVLRAGIDIDAQADDGRTALHCAARSGQVEVVRWLLKANVQCGTLKPDSSYYSVILESVQGKSLECCQLLLNMPTGAELMTEVVKLGRKEIRENLVPWPDMARLAIQVTQSDDLEIAKYVFESIPINHALAIVDNVRIDFAQTMANEAAKGGRIRMLQLLETICPAVLSGVRASQGTPLYAAVSRGQTACARLILPYMREDWYWLRRKDSKQISVGNLAFRIAASKGFADIVSAFLETEPRVLVNMINNSGRSALHDAIKRGHVDTVKVLVRHAATDVKLKGYRRVGTALHVAIRANNLEIVEVLLRCQGIDVCLRDDNGRAPLYLAVSLGLIEIVTALLEHGAKDYGALFPAFWSWETALPAVQLIIRYIVAEFNAVIDEKVIQTRAHLAEFLFNVKGYRYSYVSHDWNHLLPLAVKLNDVDLLRVLLSLDSITPHDLNKKIYEPWRNNWAYRTPLNYARNRGYTEVADLLSAYEAIDKVWDPIGELAAQEREEGLKSATKDDHPTQPAEEQPTREQQADVDVDSDDAEMYGSDGDEEDV